MVPEGQTAFQRAFDRIYNGPICSFGEVVLAFVKTTRRERLVGVKVFG